VQVLTDPAMNLLLDPEFAGEGCNPQLSTDVMWVMHNVIDCGKLTVALPGYYAYRRALPWMVSYVRSSGGDVRTADYTTPVGTLDTFTSPSPDHFFTNGVYGFCTGNYRVEPFGVNAELSDTVPVAIDPKYLIPGCPAYTDGHALILAKIDPYGELHFLDASTVSTRDLFTHNGMNCVVGITPRRIGQGGREFAGCFRGLRVYRYPIAETDETGKVLRIRRRTDLEMKEFGYSLEQFEKMAELVTSHRVTDGGVQLDSFNDFLRFRMKSVDKVVPAKFLQEYADSLLEMFKQREESVQAAWKDVQANGPIVFPEKKHPENIFNAGGRWGAWSSCADDVDRRNRYAYLGSWMDDVIQWYERMPEYVELAGLEKYPILAKGDLAQALTLEKTRAFYAREMTYTNSQGKPVRLTLLDIERRLYDLSFDPNHPPELRWGAKPGTPEFATCADMSTPLPDGTSVPMAEAYQLEAFYRTVAIKETEQSYMREICTRGFTAPDRFNQQLAKWYVWSRPKNVPPLVPSRVATLTAPAKADLEAKPVKRSRVKRPRTS
jgi:hypothetical protein